MPATNAPTTNFELRGSAPLLQVFDMPASIHFYCNQLGFELCETSSPPTAHFDWALLRFKGFELMLNTQYEQQNRPPVPDPARQAAHGDTAIYFGCPDIDAAYTFFTGKGINLKEPCITSYGFKAIYIKDPDGYWMCFHWPVKNA